MLPCAMIPPTHFEPRESHDSQRRPLPEPYSPSGPKNLPQLSALDATLTSVLASVANAGLMPDRTLLDATLTEMRGGSLHPSQIVPSLSSTLSPVVSCFSTLFCTFLRSRKMQPFSFHTIPHSGPKTPGGGRGLQPRFASRPCTFLLNYTVSISSLPGPAENSTHPARRPRSFV
jgi:hypothetical protein